MEKHKFKKIDFVKDDFKCDVQNYENHKSRIELSKIDLSSDCKMPEFIIKLKIGSQWFNIGSFGGFSSLTGIAKSRKGFTRFFFEAAAIKNGFIEETFYVKLPKGKEKIISIDTEQDENSVKYAAKRIIKMSGKSDYSNYQVYWLREFDYKERAEIIEDIIIQNTDLGILFIDGVADLASCNNDEVEGKRVAQLLMKWSSKYNIHIQTVIHQPRSHGGATGHLGAEIEKKSQSVIGVKKDGNYSIIEPKMLRHSADFTPFPFEISKDDIPRLITGEEKIETIDNYYEISTDEIPF